MLAVSCGDNQTRVFKQLNLNKQDGNAENWSQVQEINEQG
jgi:hypothetical protein